MNFPSFLNPLHIHIILASYSPESVKYFNLIPNFLCFPNPYKGKIRETFDHYTDWNVCSPLLKFTYPRNLLVGHCSGPFGFPNFLHARGSFFCPITQGDRAKQPGTQFFLTGGRKKSAQSPHALQDLSFVRRLLEVQCARFVVQHKSTVANTALHQTARNTRWCSMHTKFLQFSRCDRCRRMGQQKTKVFG